MSTVQRYDRYHRQMLLKELGESGQQKLADSRVLMIGAGGLGCPVLQYLTAAGVGQLGIVDDDVVTLSNLHRQVLYNMNDIGLPKVERAAHHLREVNPDVEIIPFYLRLNNNNALDIIRQYDIVVDGTDNFESKYMINDACVLSGKPLVYGAISKFEGQVTVFNYPGGSAERAINYRDLFPDPPGENEVLSCEEAGVLGVLPGIIGSMQASEVIKLVTGIGEPLAGRLITYNALTCGLYEITLSLNVNAEMLLPKDASAFKGTDYDLACAVGTIVEIDAREFTGLLQAGNLSVIDVRETGELPEVTEFPHLKIPLSRFKPAESDGYADAVITFCQSGKRSKTAAGLLLNTFGEKKKVYSLKGGISGWLNQQHKQ